MIRLRAYGGVTLLATLAVIYHAFSSRGQFYPATVYLSTSKISIFILFNMGLVMMLSVWHLVKCMFLGSLREAEIERLNEQGWRELMEILFAITVFRQDFSASFLTMVVTLLLIKSLHWLAQKRVEYIETTPTVTKLAHVRIVSFMGFLLLSDSFFMYSSVKHLLETRQASVSLFFAFEYMILATTTISTFLKYVFYVTDMIMEGQWERKAVYTFYLELVRDLLHLTMYLCFFLAIFVNYGIPLHLIHELYETFRNFRIRIADYLRYRKITSNMNDRFPDATPEELTASDAPCIICREEMTTAKKLICGHLFHVHCLRSWLERQQTCPTCRALVVPSESSTAAGGTHGLRQDAPQQGSASTSSDTPGTATGASRDNLSRQQARLQAAASAAAIYSKSFVYPSSGQQAWTPGYALHPQAARPNSLNTSCSGEEGSSSVLHQFPAAVEGTDLPFPQFPYLPGGFSGTSAEISDSQLESQIKFLQSHIELLQNQLQQLQKPREPINGKGKEIEDVAE